MTQTFAPPHPARLRVATAAHPALIALDGVSKLYPHNGGGVAALHNISIMFERGTFWAILGPSGSGKSTLLNLIGCLDRPTSGNYWFEGLDVGALDDDALSDLRLRRLGFIFQSFNLINQLTVLENIAMPLHYRSAEPRASRQRATLLAQQLGLADRLDHRPAELSGGQQQRAAIARALANEPDILIADEPTGNLDTTTGQQILALLADLHKQGKTIILVTHDPAIAAHAPHRLYLRDGRIERIEDHHPQPPPSPLATSAL